MTILQHSFGDQGGCGHIVLHGVIEIMWLLNRYPTDPSKNALANMKSKGGHWITTHLRSCSGIRIVQRLATHMAEGGSPSPPSSSAFSLPYVVLGSLLIATFLQRIGMRSSLVDTATSAMMLNGSKVRIVRTVPRPPYLEVVRSFAGFDPPSQQHTNRMRA